jgi:hypothetical protein
MGDATSVMPARVEPNIMPSSEQSFSSLDTPTGEPASTVLSVGQWYGLLLFAFSFRIFLL